MIAAVHQKNIERLTGPHFLGPIRVFRTGYPVNRLTVNIPKTNLPDDSGQKKFLRNDVPNIWNVL